MAETEKTSLGTRAHARDAVEDLVEVRDAFHAVSSLLDVPSKSIEAGVLGALLRVLGKRLDDDLAIVRAALRLE